MEGLHRQVDARENEVKVTAPLPSSCPYRASICLHLKLHAAENVSHISRVLLKARYVNRWGALRALTGPYVLPNKSDLPLFRYNTGCSGMLGPQCQRAVNSGGHHGSLLAASHSLHTGSEEWWLGSQGLPGNRVEGPPLKSPCPVDIVPAIN